MNAIKIAESNINSLNDAGGLTNVLLKVDYLLSGHLFQVLFLLKTKHKIECINIDIFFLNILLPHLEFD